MATSTSSGATSVRVILLVSASCVMAKSQQRMRGKSCHNATSSHLKVAGKGLLKPGASLADDALVDVPRLIATAQHHVAEVSSLEETAVDVRTTTFRMWREKLKVWGRTYLRSLDMNRF